MKYTNVTNISLPIAVWLAVDNYDGPTGQEDKTISVTTLMKSIKQLILSKRVPPTEATVDISNLLAARLGTALHSSVEHAWVKGHLQGLTSLDIPKNIRTRIKINPEPSELSEGDIPIWLELRTQKQINGWTVSGSADFIFDGACHDFKSTNTFTYTSNSKNEDYILQMSMYKWLNPTKIIHPIGYIEFLFKDWNSNKALSDPNYPQATVTQKGFKLIEPPDMEMWITNKLAQIDNLIDAPEQDLPDCNQKELWMDDPQYKYFSNPDAKRATKNFKGDMFAAQQMLNTKGKGIIKTVYGKAKACHWCSAKSVCQQYIQLTNQGLTN